MSLYDDENRELVPVMALYNIKEIETLRARIAELESQLTIATNTLCEYESREIDSGNMRGGIAATALRQIRDLEETND